MARRFLAGIGCCVVVAAAIVSATAAGRFVRDSGAAEETDRPGTRTRNHARSAYVWPHAHGPSYAAERLDEPGVLWTTAGTFRLDALQIPNELTADEQGADRARSRVHVVQCEAKAEVVERVGRTIESGGGTLLGSPSSGFLLARIPASARTLLERSVGVIAVEPYHPAFKLDPKIGRVPLVDSASALSEIYALNVRLWRGEDAQRAAARISELGGHVLRVHGDSLAIELHRSLLGALAAADAVRSVHERLPAMPFGEESTTTVQTGRFRDGATPYHDAGVDGRGGGFGFCTGDGTTGCREDSPDCDGNGSCNTEIAQVLMVLDSGVQLDAADLSHTRTASGSPGPLHRKVRVYETTEQFGGDGDLLGCDAPLHGGFTHGHVVTSTAIGRATLVAPAYGGPGWLAFDAQGNPWKLDGVAPGAVVVAYDAHRTPVIGSCMDLENAAIVAGDLYDPSGSGAGRGSLGQAYDDHGARVFNFSWGDTANDYGDAAQDIDQFAWDKKDALVFVAAGNDGEPSQGTDGPDGFNTINSVGTSRNGLTIGAGRAPGESDSPEDRAVFSSRGPVVDTTTNRVGPQLMAPGEEPTVGGMGVPSEFVCRSSDDDTNAPVECDLASGFESTSFASAAAAGAALLVRDYFAQGFHPDGRADIAHQVPGISAALTKAILVASADFLTGENLTLGHRFNNEQGYGRIQLDHALPLEGWAASPSGLAVHDPWSGTSDLALAASLGAGGSTSTTFEVCNDTEPLRVALVWTDYPTAAAVLRHDLNLTLISPSGVEYRGNYFTDDSNLNGIVAATEDCGGIGAVDPNLPDGTIDEGGWSLPVCSNTKILGKSLSARPFDNANPTEAVFLSPDPDGDGVGAEGSCTPGSEVNAGAACDDNLDCRLTPEGTGNCACDGCYRQTESGEWTIEIEAGPGIFSEPQDFAVVVAGGVCTGSSVRFDAARYSCNESAIVRVYERAESGAVGDTPDATDVSSRVTVEVIDGEVVDSETGLFFQVPSDGSLRFVSDELLLTGDTARDPGNGVLDVRDGDTLRVIYQDVNPETGAAGLLRENLAVVDCRADISFGDVVFSRFGADTGFLVEGGCERSARGLFEYDFPDRYMDAGERLMFAFGFASSESEDLHNVEVSLSCVEIDGDSPVDCMPDGTGCAAGDDPRRENNSPCGWMTIVDSPKTIGLLPAHAAISSNFAVEMAGDGPGEPFEDTGAGEPTPTVELLLAVRADVQGKRRTSLALTRQRLNVDETTLFYSTDFPSGGTEIVDAGPGTVGNNDEIAQDPITEIAGGPGANDYRFETTVYSPLTAGGRNQNLQSPWNFDAGDGGFKTGLAAPTDMEAAIFNIANWSEDRNFNGIEDGFCVADPTTDCYDFGIDTDPNCPSGTECRSLENPIAAEEFTKGWSTSGGCGWQSRASGDPTGGVWHTGIIGTPDLTCVGGPGSACANYKVIAGIGSRLVWWELLVTPVMEKVHQEIAADGLPTHGIEISSWDWNQSVNLRNSVLYTWEMDTDLARLGPVDLFVDSNVLNLGAGPFGAAFGEGDPAETRGYGLFAPIATCTGGTVCVTDEDCPIGESCTWIPGTPGVNGTLGGNREGENACFFHDPIVPSTGQSIGLARPRDDDRDNDLDGRESPRGACDALSAAPDAACYFDSDCGSGTCIGRCALSGDACTAATEAIECTTAGDRCVPRSTSYDCADGVSNEREGTCDLPAAQPCNTNDDCNAGAGTCSGGLADLADPDCIAWTDLTGEPHGIDEFVTPSGPYRNHDLSAWNGPDMRTDVLSDIYGEGGNSFQGAIGFAALEGTPANQAQQSFGLAIDDMVVRWREFGVDEDVADCTSAGACAVLELDSGSLFEGIAVVGVRLIEPTPPPFNDCDLDGSTDATDDCSGDGRRDLVVRVSSDAEIAGEIVFLERVSSTDVYAGSISISTFSNGPGVLFLAPGTGTSVPLTATYLDEDDGTGNPCPNAGQGIVRTTVHVFVGSTCDIGLVDTPFTDNGDGDRFVDTNETVSMQLSLMNHCGIELHNCTAHLFSTSPEVDCISRPVIDLGDLAASGVVTPSDAFVWKLADVERTDLSQELFAHFTVTIRCDEIDAISIPQSVSVELDIDHDTLGQEPTAWVESFESGTLGRFEAENLDGGMPGVDNTEGLFNGDGWRCQYSDPDWPNSNSYGQDIVQDCFPGANLAQSLAVFWHADGISTGAPDGGRARTGDYSMYYGVYLEGTSDFTTPLAVVESVRTTDPINLGADSPALSFWHQISLMDGRYLGIPAERSADRGVVQLKTVDSDGDDLSTWMRLVPFQNSYDTQNYDFFFNCMFDPVDDGSTEDDFFDPTDPDRRLGPSSTCHPEFTYSCIGDTDDPFDPDNICNASVDGEAGDLGTGTWVESRVDLSEFRTRRVKLRFLVSAVKAYADVHDDQFSGLNPGPWDDGWWIDDVTVNETFTDPVAIVPDEKVLKGCAGDPTTGCLSEEDCIDSGTVGPCDQPAPVCGAPCTAPDVSVVTTPEASGGALDELLAAPGHVIELDASGSSGICHDGVLQYRFSDAEGPVLRGWTGNPLFVAAPIDDTDYVVEVRCSSDATCAAFATVDVDVACPSSGNLAAPFPETILAETVSTFGWTSSLEFDLFSGALSEVGSYGGTLTSGAGNSFPSGPEPAPGQGVYFVLRTSGEFCNDTGLWTTGGAGESAARDAGGLP